MNERSYTRKYETVVTRHPTELYGEIVYVVATIIFDDPSIKTRILKSPSFNKVESMNEQLISKKDQIELGNWAKQIVDDIDKEMQERAEQGFSPKTAKKYVGETFIQKPKSKPAAPYQLIWTGRKIDLSDD